MVEVNDEIVIASINSKNYPPGIVKCYLNWRGRVKSSERQRLLRESERLRTSARWSARLNRAYRVIFEWLDDNNIVVIGVTNHKYNNYV